MSRTILLCTKMNIYFISYHSFCSNARVIGVNYPNYFNIIDVQI